MHLPHRVTATVLALSLTVPLAACTSDNSSTGGNTAGHDSSPGGDGSSAESYFPHTQQTAHGDTTIPSSPGRILALTPTAADELLALGITPSVVATDPTTLDSTAPWIAEDIHGIADATVAPERSVNVEAVADIHPDLVIGASWQFQDASLWKRVNDVAPTVIPSSPDANVGWETSLRTTAEAVGRSGRAEEIISEVKKEYRDAAGTVPEGKTYNFTGFSTTTGFFAGNGSVFRMFGLTPSASQDDTQNSSPLSPENADRLTGDLLAVWPQTDADRKFLDNDPTFRSLPAVEDGTVYYADERDANAVNAAGPHSLRWFLGRVTGVVSALG